MPAIRTQTATIKTQAGTNTITSNSFTSTAGRSLFAAASFGGVATTWNTPTDSKGNTWSLAVTKVNLTLGVAIAYCLAPGSVGASHTVTMSEDGVVGSADMCVAFCEYSGIANVAGSNSNNGTSTGPTTGAVSLNGSRLYLIAENNAGAPTITPDAAWTQVSENESGSSAQPLNLSEQRAGSGSLNGGWTLGSSQAWVAVIAAFNLAAKANGPYHRSQRFFRRASGLLVSTSKIFLGMGG